jgi:hypothetical protein
VLAVAPLLGGCDDTGVVVSPVATEPLTVQGGQFFSGPLPTGTGPKVDFINTPASVFPAGAINKTLTGDADMGATSVLLRFSDLGTGYWSVPVGMTDITMSNGALTWSAICSFSDSIPSGRHPLVFNAMDAKGNAGPAPGQNQTETLTFLSAVPKGDVVISLVWDTAADLDLHLVAPDGTELDPEHPTTAAMRAPGAPPPPGTATLDRDANASCIEDPSPEEDAVFADPPAPGKYIVRVDMFSSCGAPAADFAVSVRVRGKETQRASGVLLAEDADGGGPGSGLLVMQLNLCGCGDVDAGTPCTADCDDF